MYDYHVTSCSLFLLRFSQQSLLSLKINSCEESLKAGDSGHEVMANVALNLRDSTRIKQWCCKRFVKRVDNRGLTLVRLVLHEAKTKRVLLMSSSGLDALCYSEGVKHETRSLRGRDVPVPTCQAEAFQMQAIFYGVEFKHAGNSFF